MSFTPMSVSVEFLFKSNGKKFFSDLDKATDTADRGFRSLTDVVLATNSALDTLGGTIGGISKALNGLSAAALKASQAFDASMTLMGGASDMAATRVTAATNTMAAGFANVTAAARAAAAASATVGRVPRPPGGGFGFTPGPFTSPAGPAGLVPIVQSAATPLMRNVTPIAAASTLAPLGQPPPYRAFGIGSGGSGGPAGPMPPGGGRRGFNLFRGPGADASGLALPSALQHGLSGAALLNAGAGVGLAIDAVHEAGKLQTILQTTRNITGASDRQMSALRQQLFDVGDQSGMSVVQSADMFRSLSRQSQGAMSFNDMRTMLPYMAKFQTVMGAARHFSPEQTTDSVMALTHLFRTYNAKAMPAMFDNVLRMGELMPDNLSRAVTQMTYFLPTLKNLHVSDLDASTYMIAMSRFGMAKGKGGTSLQNLLADALPGLQLTQHAQKGKAGLMGPGEGNLNIVDASGQSRFFKDGKPGDIFGFTQALADYQKKYGGIRAQQVFTSVFGKQGSRMGDMIADPILLDQLKRVRETVEHQSSLGLGSQAKSIFDTAQFQEGRSLKNFQSLMTEVGTLALPGVTRGFKDLGNTLHDAQHWLHQHRSLELRVQRDIVGGIMGVERYIVAHRKDWQTFGSDLGYVYGEATKLGPIVKLVADNMGSLYNAVKSVDDILNKITGAENAIGKWLREHAHGGGNADEYTTGTNGPGANRQHPSARPTVRARGPERHAAVKVVPMRGALAMNGPAPIHVHGGITIHADGNNDVEALIRSAKQLARHGPGLHTELHYAPAVSG